MSFFIVFLFTAFFDNKKFRSTELIVAFSLLFEGEHPHDHDHDHSHDGDYDHSFWSHGHKLRSENPCDGVANAEIKLSTGTKKFIFTSKNAQ